MMMKKTLTLAAAISAAIMAAPAGAADLYVGINAGWNATDIEGSSSFKSGGQQISETGTESVNGAAFGGVAGIKFPISTGYLAIEANISDSSAESEGEVTIDGVTVFHSTLTSDLSYGISGILATDLNKTTQFYGVAGYQMTDFEYQYADRDTATNNTASGAKSETFGGARVGVGVESTLTDALSMRLEWTQTFYSEESMNMDSATAGTLPVDIKPTESRITLGVIGHF